MCKIRWNILRLIWTWIQWIHMFKQLNSRSSRSQKIPQKTISSSHLFHSISSCLSPNRYQRRKSYYNPWDQEMTTIWNESTYRQTQISEWSKDACIIRQKMKFHNWILKINNKFKEWEFEIWFKKKTLIK